MPIHRLQPRRRNEGIRNSAALAAEVRANLIAILTFAVIIAIMMMCPVSVNGSPGDLTLTPAHPLLWLPIPAETLAAPAPRVAITLLRITNPQQAAFSVAVSLRPRPGSQATQKQEAVAVSTLGVYPSDQPGRYQLDLSSALTTLRRNPQLTGVDLCLELKLLHPNQRSAGLAVVVSPPEWNTQP